MNRDDFTALTILRWPVIRHVRFAWNVLKFQIWWTFIGRHLVAWPNESDLDYLRDIWEGRA